MKLIYLPIAVIILSVIGCASSQTLDEDLTKPEITQTIERKAVNPDWYEPSVDSYIENNILYGVGTASALNRDEAAKLAEESAKSNLKKLIDSKLEEVRIGLAESDFPEAGSSDFIFKLRNTVSNLSLNLSGPDIQYFEKEKGVVMAYVRQSIATADLKALLDDTNLASELINSL